MEKYIKPAMDVHEMELEASVLTQSLKAGMSDEIMDPEDAM